MVFRVEVVNDSKRLQHLRNPVVFALLYSVQGGDVGDLQVQ